MTEANAVPIAPGFDLQDLNDPQREAVLHDEGPLLVLAGAGSGKTRVVTCRIARLIKDCSVPPWRVLAVTFTNKAAREMTGRIEAMIGEASRGLWIGTFHSVCSRILRSHADKLGYGRDFTICDADEQKDLLKRIIHDLNWDPEKWQAARVRSKISYAKNHFQSPDNISQNTTYRDGTQVAELYKAYQERLKRANSVDFDDLLLLTHKLLVDHAEVRSHYQGQFEYVVVDEYQDTNGPQHEITTILVEPQRNLCVVGDDDQSIYRWRGAQFQNILGLPEVFTDLRIIRLEQNYRSTPNIVSAAQAVISKNQARHGKDLFTVRSEGEPVRVLATESETDEGEKIAILVAKAISEGVSANDICLLYRTNAQSRVLEEAFVRHDVPYKIIGGMAFYQRKEIRTLLAYLRMLIQPHNDAAFLRTVNSPKRGIGQTTISQLVAKASALSISLFEAAKNAASFPEIGSSGAQKVQTLCLMINHWSAKIEEKPLEETLSRILDDIEYQEALEKEDRARAVSRWDNVRELKTALQIAEMATRVGELLPWQEVAAGEEVSRVQKLEVFLERVALDSSSEEEGPATEAVSLMTIHAAKGLEFSYVFMTGMEEGLFPHSQSMNSPEEVEEERRLCYVGMTRAKDHLVLSYAHNRFIYGTHINCIRSRFLDELPKELVENIGVVVERGLTKDQQFHGPQSKSRYRSNWKPERSSVVTAPRSSKPKTPPPDFLVPGRSVRHKTFGLGNVLNVEGVEPALKVTVDFNIVGVKTVVQKYAKLEPA